MSGCEARCHVNKRFPKGVHGWRDLPEPDSPEVGAGKTCQTSWSRNSQIRVRDMGLSETSSTDHLLVCNYR